MTANQINFYKAKEEAKHWKRLDKESKRHNVQDEAIRSESNAIQSWWNTQQAAHLVRSDAINNAHYERMDAESQRHNKAEERKELLYYDTVDLPVAKANVKYLDARAGSEPLYVLNDNIVKSAQAGYYNMQSKYYPLYFVMDSARSSAQNFSDYAGVVVDAIKTVMPQIRINLSAGNASNVSGSTGINTSGRYSNYSVRMGR